MFLGKALSRAGVEEMITPREIIRDFLTLLNILRDNKDATFEALMSNVTFSRADSEDVQESPAADIVAIAQPKNKINLFDIEI